MRGPAVLSKHDELVARVRKLRERGTYRGDDVNLAAEATNARRLAAELMRRHRLTERDFAPSRAPRAPERPVSTPRPAGPLARPPRRRVPVRLDLDFAGIKIKWEGEL